MLGKTISHYKILEKLGEGGMGVVYKAEDLKLKRTVALKFLPPELTRDPEAKERFIQEAQAASALDHPNICTIFEIDETEDGQMFISMVYYEGETLKQKIKNTPLSPPSRGETGGCLAVNEVIDIAIQIAQGLVKAHEHGIVHRDIKPGNIMITKDGMVKILDFGLAKLAGQVGLTKTGTTVGTIAYMSPEQARGEEVDHRTDIWSFGVLLYEMVTGKLPFKGEYEQAVVYSILNEEPEPMTGLRTAVPIDLERIINKCLEKKAEGRYRHLDEMNVDLKSFKKNLQSGKTKQRPSKTRYPKKKTFYIATGLVVLIALFVIFRNSFFNKPNKVIDSIAVLSFENLTGDPMLDYLSDGIAQGISYRLSQLPNLRKVTPFSSVMHFKGKTIEVKTIAKEFNVQGVVLGRMSLLGENITIDVELIDGLEDNLIMGYKHTRPRTSVLEMEKILTEVIVDTLGIQLSVKEKERLTKSHTENAGAYEAYLLGQHYLGKRLEQDIRTAIKYFERALAIDSTYALGYAGIASAYANLGFWNILPPQNAWPNARTMAEKALTIDEELAEAHTVLALMKTMYDWDWLGAEKEFKRTLDINPNSADAHTFYGHFLSFIERHDEAIVQAEKALELDPHSFSVKFFRVWTLYWAGHKNEALRLARYAVDSDPNQPLWYWALANFYANQGMYEEAFTQLRTQIVIMGDDVSDESGLLGYIYGRLGQKEDALRVLEQLDELSAKGRYVSSVLRAWIYIGLDDKDQALAWLEKGYKTRTGWMTVIKTWFIYDTLRNDPRFTAILKKMGLEK